MIAKLKPYPAYKDSGVPLMDYWGRLSERGKDEQTQKANHRNLL